MNLSKIYLQEIKNNYINNKGYINSKKLTLDLYKIKPLFLNNFNREFTNREINDLIETFVDNLTDIIDPNLDLKHGDIDKIKFYQEWKNMDLYELSERFIDFVDDSDD